MAKRNNRARNDIVKNGQVVGEKIERAFRGEDQIKSDREIAREEYKLNWFHPTSKQKEIIDSINTKPCTLVEGTSGVGKSTTVIWHALRLLQTRDYQKIIFIKTPTQLGVDDVGFLGTNEAKFDYPLMAMKSIFQSFMSKEKLEMEEKRDKIQFTFPNWLGGITFSNSIVIVDEIQWFTPEMVKLVLERCDDTTKVICMFDSKQRYANKQRPDGARDLVNKITRPSKENSLERVVVEDLFGYVKLSHNENRRGPLSKRITELYDDLTFENTYKKQKEENIKDPVNNVE